MRNSPSLAEMAKSYRENTSEIRSPIIADLQTEYVKALNLIDTLKAEKRERKVIIFNYWQLFNAI